MWSSTLMFNVALWWVKLKVAQLGLTLGDPMDYTIHGILQARILEQESFPFSRGSSQPSDQTKVSIISGKFFTSWTTRESGKKVCQGYILSSCLFNLYAEYIMWNAGLDEAQTGIKITGRNINNFWYADDTTLTAESEEPLDERGEWKSWLKTQHSEN